MPTTPTRKRAGLSRERVFRAALEIADADGVEALSMRKLGRALGVEAMSLYHYVPDKAAILAGIAEAVYAEVELPATAPDAPWRTGLADLMRALRTALLRHPGALPALATHEVTGGTGLHLYETALRLLADAGVDLVEAHHALSNLTTYTLGHCLAIAGRAPFGVPEPTPGERRAFAAGLDADRYPTVRAWLARVGEHGIDTDAMYERGLAGLLAAVPGP